MKSGNIIEQLLKIAPKILENYPVYFAYLYGSFARKAVHPFSDIDIAIYVEDISDEDILDLELQISVQLDNRFKAGDKFDVRAINRLPLIVRGKILTEGQLVYSADEEKRVEFEVITRKLYFDFLPVINQYHDEYIKTVAKGERWF